jgi:penicillin amidase
MPAEIAALGLPIEPWTALDSLALGALMARNVASDGGQELENAKLLADLITAHGEAEGRAIFDDLLWANDPGAPTSVPAEEGEFSSYPDGGPLESSIVTSAQVTMDLPPSYVDVARQLRVERNLRTRLQDELGLPNPGSNVWAVSPQRSSNGSTLLFNGPQVGYTMPGLLTEFELHIAEEPYDMDAKGVTVAGVPVVGIGFTDHHIWGLTSGLSDTKDLYVEQLVDDDRHYLFDGEVLEMDCRTESFIVKSTLELSEGTPPSVEEHEFCRTIHGPVIEIDAEAGVAYSQRYATWQEEVGTLKGLFRFPLADSLEEFTEAMSMVTWNENTTYADAAGHIAYWHPGLYPRRPRDFDERLPYPGTGEAEWEGMLDFDQMPHTIDPAQGWVANWNSKPSVGWTSGDPHYGDRPWGQANRLHSLSDVLGSDAPIGELPAAGEDGLVEGLGGIFAPDVNGGVFDQTIDYFRPFLAEAATDPAATERQRLALEQMVSWDGDRRDADADGRYDQPAVALFDAWVEPAAKSVFGKYLTIGGFSRGGHRFEPSPVINLFLRSLLGDEATLPQSRDYLEGRTNPEVILTTLDDALGRLEEAFGTSDMDAWLGDIYTAELEGQGVGPGGEIPFQDRGSWIQVIEYPGGPGS